MGNLYEQSVNSPVRGTKYRFSQLDSTDSGCIRIMLIGLGSPDHYNRWNNLSLDTLAGDLRGYFGHGVSVTFGSTSKIPGTKDLLRKFFKQAPHIIGISMQPGSLELTRELIAGLASVNWLDQSEPLVVFGNQIPTYFPEKILEICPWGIIVRGEGELSLRGLVQLVRGECSLSAIPNLVYKDASTGDIAYTLLETPDLSSLSYPPAMDTCQQIIAEGGNVQVQASRGCPWGGCVYCTRTSFRRGGIVFHRGNTASWKGFSVSRVLKTVEQVILKGISEIEFSDDEFLGGRDEECVNRILAIADGIEALSREYDIRLTFRIFSRPDLIYRANDTDRRNEVIRNLLLRLKQVGLVKVFIGIEAGNPSQLKRYCRGLTLEDVMGSLNVMRELRLGVDVGFIMFDPGLSLKEMLENIQFFRENRLMPYNQWPFRPMVVNEGSRLSKTGRMGEPDVNFISYSYSFENEFVGEIARIVDKTSATTRPLFYALKQKSKKYFGDCKRDVETRLVQAYVEENGHIYLKLMEALAMNIETASISDIMNMTKGAGQKALDLARRVRKDVTQGRISDQDDYLKDEFDNIGL